MSDNGAANRGFLKAELRQMLTEYEARLDARLEAILDASERRILVRFREMNQERETRIIRAFYSFAERNEERVKGIEIANSGISGRVASLETRVLEIEKRLKLPPVA